MKIVIDRFEGDQAVIVLPDAQKLVIAKKELPVGVKEGDTISLNFSVDEAEIVKNEDQAKAILNEILKS